VSWLKVGDRDLADPCFTCVSRDARLLHLEALSWSMAYSGDGSIPRHSIESATTADGIEALVSELVLAGLWLVTRDGWQIVYMLDDQMSPEEIARQREYNKSRQERHRRHVVGDHSTCDPRFCRNALLVGKAVTGGAARNAVRNALPGRRNTHVTPLQTDPDPTRPKEGRRSKGTLRGRRSPSAAPSAPRAERVYGPMSDETKAKIRAKAAERRAAKLSPRVAAPSEVPVVSYAELQAAADALLSPDELARVTARRAYIARTIR
jgi:hypothetical protein